MSNTLALAATLALMSVQALAHGPMMNDPAHKEKMEQMMKGRMDKGVSHSHGGSGHSHSQSSVKEQKDWGIAGDPKKASRTIRIDMTDDMKFTPAAITVKKDETIRFQVFNKGKVMHEMVIGTKKELDSHAEMMKKHPNMEHDEPYMAHVEPGKSETMTWLFNRPGEFFFACLIPGHYEAGMVGKIKVSL